MNQILGYLRNCIIPSRKSSCGAALLADDIAIFRKLVNRNAEEFLCIDCLSKRLGCTREKIENLIKYYRESGDCTLFLCKSHDMKFGFYNE